MKNKVELALLRTGQLGGEVRVKLNPWRGQRGYKRTPSASGLFESQEPALSGDM